MIRRRSLVGGAIATLPLIITKSTHASTGQRAISGDTILSNQDEIRLDDILAPKIADISGAPEPFAFEAQRALADLIRGGALGFQDSGERDRWGRRIAHVWSGVAENGQSLQEKLVANGFARVDPRSDRYDFIRRLHEVEIEARDTERGLWRLRRYSIVDAMRADPAIGAFHLVEGEVVKTATHSGRTYLNFGDDYKIDFTITARSVLARRWIKKGLDLLASAGRKIRVRGFIEKINGPTIELKHPLQIELIGPAAREIQPEFQDAQGDT